MRDIRASVEVRALIGADKLRELHEDARERYECWQCGRTGRTTEPTSVIVLAYRVFRVVKLAHAGCADPQIIEVDAAGMRTVAGQIATATSPASAGSGTAASPRRNSPGRGVPGMKTTWLARKLGLDGNPLRRRTDKIAAWAAALLVAVFLIGAPLLSVAAAGWAGRAGAADQRAERSWRQVPAVLLQAPPAPAAVGGIFGHSRVRARWTAPDGRARTGQIPVSTGMAAGRTVPLWVDAAGSPAGPPLNRRTVVADEATAAVVATAALGLVLLCLAWAGRWLLDRRRLADWEVAWASVGPQWTKRFRSRG